MRRLSRVLNSQAVLEVMWTCLACLMFVVSATSYLPKTSQGIQCPTAKVQEIEVVRTVETCCGKMVQVVEKRAPQPGEEGFVQCQCKEKKSSNAMDGSRMGELPTFTLPRPLRPCPMPVLTNLAHLNELTTTLPRGPVYSPPTPPPNFI